jgi:peroxiredoxin Q/BCP
MALEKGSIAPDFKLKSAEGEEVSLKDVKGGNGTVIFFFPKAFTKVCTAEVCSFKDKFAEFRSLNVPVIGISRDSIDKLAKFKKEYDLPFHVLSDRSGKVCKAYKAAIPIIGMPKRITYILDGEGKVINSISDMFDANSHIQDSLRTLQKA